MDSNRAVRPILARAISSKVSSIAVEVRTATICGGGMESGEDGRGRSIEE